MSVLSTVGAVVLALIGLGLGVLALSVGYLGSFNSSGLTPVDGTFTAFAALGSLVCIVAAIALFASRFKQAKG